MTTTPTATTELKMITWIAPTSRARLAFWSGLLGWEVAVVQDEYAMLTHAGAPALGLGRVEDYEAPAWPNPRGTKQFHLDLGCSDVDASEARAVELGARVPDEQPGETWRVLLSPAGHPFCLTDAANW